jgi:hypothetical protein
MASVFASKVREEVPLVLALQAPPIYFLVEEIQPEDLMTDEQLQDLENNASPNIVEHAEKNELQVGMVLLPNDLDVDPGFSALVAPQTGRKSLGGGVRLWAKFFAPVPNSDRVEIPLGWENFFHCIST